ncbi:hypothetical protein CK620_02270 [Vandammella animalimorsus]|uniref:Uncharacterized protein n=1 Tax=Vandammella animalimorsus TaxID=2029117 RepID=A0A2A2AC18_9BURK|nr:hypothetical protein CK620_02270 [Vandammella animalimorsus]
MGLGLGLKSCLARCGVYQAIGRFPSDKPFAGGMGRRFSPRALFSMARMSAWEHEDMQRRTAACDAP